MGRVIARLDGAKLPGAMDGYLELARMGVGGFIVFGGEIGEVRRALEGLQDASGQGLLICSDMEQGVGQQLRGGTVFPPARAMGLLDEGTLRETYSLMAREARYAGINAILAPVMDLDTNPLSPIISTRSYGPDPVLAARAGGIMIEALGREGVASCIKHFPGHGDTQEDSHLMLPVIHRTLGELEARELVPFKRAVGTAPMLMLGHLVVEALTGGREPVSISREAVDYIRGPLGFEGVLLTDAMDMGAIGSRGGMGEYEAALMALEAGVDIILHPSDPVRMIRVIADAGYDGDSSRLSAMRARLPRRPGEVMPSGGGELSLRTVKGSVEIEGDVSRLDIPMVAVIVPEGADERGAWEFISLVRRLRPGVRASIERPGGAASRSLQAGGMAVIAAGSVRAYKGRALAEVREAVGRLARGASALAAMGPASLIDVPGTEAVPKIYAHWDGPDAWRRVAELLFERVRTDRT